MDSDKITETVEIDATIAGAFEKVCNEYDISPSEAIERFIKASAIAGEFPFDIEDVDYESQKAMDEIENTAIHDVLDATYGSTEQITSKILDHALDNIIRTHEEEDEDDLGNA